MVSKLPIVAQSGRREQGVRNENADADGSDDDDGPVPPRQRRRAVHEVSPRPTSSNTVRFAIRMYSYTPQTAVSNL